MSHMTFETDTELIQYRRFPNWGIRNLPELVQQVYHSPEGSWLKHHITAGKIKVDFFDPQGNLTESKIFYANDDIPLILPLHGHKLEIIDPAFEGFLECFCEPDNYFVKKHKMTATHSEIIALAKQLAPCKTLDLGCGWGRNALYLSKKGFDVTAYDYNPSCIAQIIDIADEEELNIHHAIYDMNTASLADDYDFIFATVSLMFVQPERFNDIIANIQQHTRQGGYNLIVMAIDTDEVPCPIRFSTLLKAGQLKDHYPEHQWKIHKYVEEMGSFHKTDEHGNPIQAMFATLVAEKIAN